MKAYTLIYVFVLAVGFSISTNVLADSAPTPPRCSQLYYETWAAENEQQNVNCKAIEITLTLSNSNEFQNTIVFLDKGRDDYAPLEDPKNGGLYTLHKTDKVYKGKVAYFIDYIAVNKRYFDLNDGLKGVFYKKSFKDEEGYGRDYIEMYPRNEKGFLQNSFPVVLFTTNSQDFMGYGYSLDFYAPDLKKEYPSKEDQESILERNKGRFLHFPVWHYPYDAVPLMSPIIAKQFIYEPLGFIKDGGVYKLLVYKSKEIWTLDNNKKKTKTFKPPSVKGLQKSVPGFKK